LCIIVEIKFKMLISIVRENEINFNISELRSKQYLKLIYRHTFVLSCVYFVYIFKRFDLNKLFNIFLNSSSWVSRWNGSTLNVMIIEILDLYSNTKYYKSRHQNNKSDCLRIKKEKNIFQLEFENNKIIVFGTNSNKSFRRDHLM